MSGVIIHGIQIRNVGHRLDVLIDRGGAGRDDWRVVFSQENVVYDMEIDHYVHERGLELAAHDTSLSEACDPEPALAPAPAARSRPRSRRSTARSSRGPRGSRR